MQQKQPTLCVATPRSEAEQEQEAEATEKPQVNRKTPPLASTTSSFMERQRSMQLPNAQTTEAGT